MKISTRIIGTLIAILFAVAMFFVLLFTSMQVVVFNMNYFEYHYEKRDIAEATEMSMEDLMMVTEHMMDYLADKEENLDMQAEVNGNMEEVFGEREKLHMVDVKNLFVSATWIRNISVLFIGLVIVLGIVRYKPNFRFILGGVKYVFITLLLLFVGLGYLFYTDFSKYFIIFHEIFFDNDLWLLNPRTDILINMVPQDFFFATAMICIGIFLGTLILIGILAEIGRKRLALKANI